MANDSVETWRLYSAESSLQHLGPWLGNLEGVRSLVRRCQESAWWRWQVREQIEITIEIGGNDDPGFTSSYSLPSNFPPTSWTISMHPERLREAEVLHELAHCIAPRYLYGGETPDGRIPDHRALPDHGAHYAGVRLALAREFMAPEAAGELEQALEHFRVEVAPWTEVAQAREETLLAEKDLIEVQARSPEGFRVVMALASPRRGFSPSDLGRELTVGRFFKRGTNGRRLSQQAAAERISSAVKCSRRDVSRVENLVEPPATKREYQVALALAVLFDIDPVRAQFQLGLNRDDWDLPLSTLKDINPDWVALVEEMNELINARPPRWLVDPRV